MKSMLLGILMLSAVLLSTGCKPANEAQAVIVSNPTIVEAACGRCLFGHKEDKKCNLAIRLDGKSYFVDGFNIQQFGNPDLHGGMCKKIHKAHVTGKVENARFTAKTFELLPLASR